MLEYTSVSFAASNHAELATRLTSLVADGHTVEAIVGADGSLVAFLSRQVGTSAPSGQASPTWASHPVPTPAANPTPSATPVQPAVEPAVQAAPAATVPADWYKDPAGRYEYRYWDGSKWTTKVSRAGVMYDDPATP